MRIKVAGSKIICCRVDNTVEGAKSYRRVAEFDAHLEAIPPHVVPRLTTAEIGELESFLSERQKIQASSSEVNMLEALLEMIEEVSAFLQSADRLNETMHRRLSAAITDLIKSLDNVKPETDQQDSPIRKMERTEALKERLDNIRRDL